MRVHNVCRDRSPPGALLLLLGLSSAAAWAVGRVESQVMRDTSRYSRIPRASLQMIERSEAPFVARDAAAVGAALAPDYQWWNVGPQGPVKVIEGRERTVAVLGQMFASREWLGSKVYRLGMVGNLLVQVEVDRIASPGGPVDKVSLQVQEFRGGQRWRDWRFTPEAPPAPQ